jgi:hypothetical protein
MVKRWIASCLLAVLVMGMGSAVAFASQKPHWADSTMRTFSQKPHWEE